MKKLKAKWRRRLEEKDIELTDLLADFGHEKTLKQAEVYEMRKEMILFYDKIKQQAKLIHDVESGVFAKGLRSHYVPPK